MKDAAVLSRVHKILASCMLVCPSFIHEGSHVIMPILGEVRVFVRACVCVCVSSMYVCMYVCVSYCLFDLVS